MWESLTAQKKSKVCFDDGTFAILHDVSCSQLHVGLLPGQVVSVFEEKALLCNQPVSEQHLSVWLMNDLLLNLYSLAGTETKHYLL